MLMFYPFCSILSLVPDKNVQQTIAIFKFNKKN